MVNLINYNNYQYNGWGLSLKAIKSLERLVAQNNISNVLEFGSGQSTLFFNDLGVNFTSIDNDVNFAAKHDNVQITKIKQTDDKTFNQIINNEVKFKDISSELPVTTNIHTRMKNCFYDVSDLNLNSKFDLIIVDGPHGNGRSIAYNYIQDYVKDIFFILIDDYNHYPFIDHFKLIFPDNELLDSNTEKGDNWSLYKAAK